MLQSYIFSDAFPSEYPLPPSSQKTVGAPDRNLTNTFNRKNEVILRFAKHHTLLLTGWKLGMDPSLDVLARIIFRVSIDVKICTSTFSIASWGKKKRRPCFQIIPHNQGMIHNKCPVAWPLKVSKHSLQVVQFRSFLGKFPGFLKKIVRKKNTEFHVPFVKWDLYNGFLSDLPAPDVLLRCVSSKKSPTRCTIA